MMAAQMAGLEVIQFLAEPTAAAVAYFGSHPDALSGHDVGDKGPMKVLVVDFSGGTFDVSAIEYARGHFTVKAVDGDLDLGGRDIDTAIVGKLLQVFKAKTGKEIVSSTPKGRKALARLRAQAEAAKHAISTQLSHTIVIDSLYEGEDLVYTLSRAVFKKLARPIVDRARPYITESLRAAGWDKGKPDLVLLAGGSSRIPLFEALVVDVTGVQPSKALQPDLAIAEGAAIVAHQRTTADKERCTS
jgi:molecular chaperone DnaK (HSP70)